MTERGSAIAVADRSGEPASLSFAEAVRARHSVRAFRPDPLPDAVIRAVLEDAQQSPSNCNTQPWIVHVVSGAKRDALSQALLAAAGAGRFTPDYSFDMDAYFGCFAQRQADQASGYFGALGIARDDAAARADSLAANFRFFDAPHVALLFMPAFGDSVRAAGDVGMYGQTLLLALAARGLGGVPQTALGFMAQTIRDELGISDDLKLLFGISFGYSDLQAPANRWRADRAPITESVTFHG